MVLVAVWVVLHATPVAADCSDPEPEWLACEDFEEGSLGWDAWFAQSPWVECLGCSGGSSNPDRIVLLDDAAAAHSGNWSLYLPAASAAGYQGASLTFRTCAGAKAQGCALTNYDELYLRAWVRLAADHQYVHHFLALAGTRPDAYWECDGNAGCRPNGYRAAGTTLDFDTDHSLFFYTYFPDMSCDSGGYCSGDYAQSICDGCATKEMPCESGLECCWGNIFRPSPEVILPRGEWVCLEIGMRLNTPGAADGQMTFWINDVLGLQQTGMSWRDVSELGLNKAWLQHYIASGDATQSNRVWFDDVVVSTARIGCAAGPPPTPDAGPEPAVDGSVAAVDGSAPAADAGAAADDAGAAVSDAASIGPGADDAKLSGGCGCETAERSSSAPVFMGLALLVWLFVCAPRRRGTRAWM